MFIYLLYFSHQDDLSVDVQGNLWRFDERSSIDIINS